MEVAARDPWDELDDLEREARRVNARMVDVVARLEARWPDDPCVPDLSCELSHRYGVSQYEASERIRIATALQDLPALREAHVEGRLSWAQLRWVTRFAIPATDQHWSVRAPRMSPNQLRLEAHRQLKVRQREAESDHANRGVWMGWDDEGATLSGEFHLAREQGVALEQAVHAAAQTIEADREANDPRAARLADALINMVTRSGGQPERPTLVVHTDAEVLADVTDGTRHLAESSTGVQLHPDAIRRIGCMAKVRVAIEREGTLVGLVSASRGPTDAQLDALWFRDRTCTFPGCETKRYVEAHHIRHWADGGQTTLDNLTLLCGRHHRMLHEGGWTIRGRPPDLEFVDRWERVRTGAVPELARAG